MINHNIGSNNRKKYLKKFFLTQRNGIKWKYIPFNFDLLLIISI